MDFYKLNKAAHVVPTKKLRDLTVGGFYKISDLRRVETKYGSKIVAEIENSYIVFLPQRRVQVFAEDSTLFENLRKEATEKEVFIKYLSGVYN